MGIAPLVFVGRIAEQFGPFVAIAVTLVAIPLLTPMITSLCAVVGVFRHHSRFLVSMPKLGARQLHLGTGFDRVCHRRELGGWSGPEVRARLMISVLDGLIAIGEAGEAGALPPEAAFSATSYLFTASTARRLGFDVRRPSVGDRLVFVIGWLDAMVWLSIVQGRLTFPSLATLLRVRITAGALASRLPVLRARRCRLERRTKPDYVW